MRPKTLGTPWERVLWRNRYAGEGNLIPGSTDDLIRLTSRDPDGNYSVFLSPDGVRFERHIGAEAGAPRALIRGRSEFINISPTQIQTSTDGLNWGDPVEISGEMIAAFSDRDRFALEAGRWVGVDSYRILSGESLANLSTVFEIEEPSGSAPISDLAGNDHDAVVGVGTAIVRLATDSGTVEIIDWPGSDPVELHSVDWEGARFVRRGRRAGGPAFQRWTQLERSLPGRPGR